MESQLVYEPCLSSQLFKSTETIQETVEDFGGGAERQSGAGSKRSKASWAHTSTSCAETQTEDSREGVWARYYRAARERLVSGRIRK